MVKNSLRALLALVALTAGCASTTPDELPFVDEQPADVSEIPIVDDDVMSDSSAVSELGAELNEADSTTSLLDSSISNGKISDDSLLDDELFLNDPMAFNPALAACYSASFDDPDGIHDIFDEDDLLALGSDLPAEEQAELARCLSAG